MFGHFLMIFWEGFASHVGAGSVCKKCRKITLSAYGVRFPLSRKNLKNMQKTTVFHEKSIPKRDRPKYSQTPRFSSFFEGPKRLKTDHFEVKIASSTSNGTFLRLLKKFLGLLRKHSILHRFFMHFQAPHGVSDSARALPTPPGPPLGCYAPNQDQLHSR